MNRFFVLILLLIGSMNCVSYAASPRAHWISSKQIQLKLLPGSVNSTNSHFFLKDVSVPLDRNALIELPVIKAQSDRVFLSTENFSAAEIDSLIRRPLQLIVTNSSLDIVDVASVHFTGLLDERYFYSESDLGGICQQKLCSLKVWAPTAQNVKLHLYTTSEQPQEESIVYSLVRNSKGVWSITLPKKFKNSFYLYEVSVYSPLSEKVETSLVTDPYSFSLSLNGRRSQMINPQDLDSFPSHWLDFKKPPFNKLNDAVIYELHIRDFSANDLTVPPEKRGTYLAFTEKNSAGIQHLKDLANSGLTHLHLLPFNDFGSVDENKKNWPPKNSNSADLTKPQALIGLQRSKDPYNWGYDPVHYFVPEGSYAVNGDGISRIKEMREMLQSLNSIGLRVIQDVVFNHTYQSGAEEFSVYDKIVPLYYYRLSDDGEIQKSSCCWDTASENKMVEKLMLDSVLYWARVYKVDGFRFDLMSFHSRSTMAKIFEAVRNLNTATDGIDGSKILLYGEGWSFGSLYSKSPDQAMTIENSFGSQIGFFNDRLRDAVRGGTTSSSEKSDQGFATGLFFDFNYEPANRGTPTDLPSQRDRILHYGDVIKSGLAGNLRDFYFREHLGNTIRSGDLRFRGALVAFASQALETVNYVSAHDGYGLWDAIQAKAPFYSYGRVPALASTEERLRMHQLALSIPLLAQGIPFIEGGTELLRSKNGDQDSYDSGDFFNRIDWTGQTNYWGEGLPPAWKNLNDWTFWEPRLKDPALQVNSSQIQRVNKYFQALLRLRRSSSLFKMNSLAEISQHLHFIDNDRQAEPGLIAMHLQNSKEEILVLFNASREARYFQHDLLHLRWRLHPEFNADIDAALAQVVLHPEQSSVQIPGRTTVVLQIDSPERVQ